VAAREESWQAGGVRIELVHDPGLGNGAYLVEVDRGRALLVDPDRRVGRYLAAAEACGWEIVAVAETHLHADFVSGALEISRATGADVIAPAEAEAAFPHRPVRGGQRLDLGAVELEVRATPGHAPEHVAYVARAGSDEPAAVFSGGALIAGGAARSDLVAPERTDELSRAAFRSAREAFADLPDDTPVYPTHGGGSFCSTGGGGSHTTTLGTERRTNPVLTFAGGADAFAAWWPTTFPATPTYFARMRAVNRAGPRPVGEIPPPAPVDPHEAAALVEREDVLTLDCRPADAYARSHVQGSLAIPLRDAFPTWLGWLAPAEARLLLVADEQDLDAIVDACLVVGYESFAGWLRGGIEAWIDEGLPVRSLPTIGPEDAVPWLEMGARPLDVREREEFELGRIAGAVNVPLGALAERAGELPDGRPLLAYCASGLRSTTAASVLERIGVGPVVQLRGGYGAWRLAHVD
jgi:hydroxyacylglutathione hydrolase